MGDGLGDRFVAFVVAQLLIQEVVPEFAVLKAVATDQASLANIAECPFKTLLTVGESSDKREEGGDLRQEMLVHLQEGSLAKVDDKVGIFRGGIETWFVDYPEEFRVQEAHLHFGIGDRVKDDNLALSAAFDDFVVWMCRSTRNGQARSARCKLK